jgi:hypothetical protein
MVARDLKMMKPIEILRLAEIEGATFGTISIDGDPFCWTLEPPDLLNTPNVSCIPVGIYLCRAALMQDRQLDTYLITSVPQRSSIFFHTGNTVDDTEGCIILGLKIGRLFGKKAVLESRNAFKEFMERMDDVAYARLEIKVA